MEREELYDKVHLDRLNKKYLPDFFNSMLGNIDFMVDFENRIYQETEGNPLFMMELGKFMIEENIIKQIDGIWKESEEIQNIEIPSKVYNLIAGRMNRLERGDRRIVDYASVFGETIVPSIIADALNINKVHLLERLKEIEQTFKVIHSFDGNFRFNHTKIKEVLYNEIPLELRKEYHLIIANSVENKYFDEIENAIYLLAQHYYFGGDFRQSLHYSVKAGEEALSANAPEKAIEFYERALDSVHKLGQRHSVKVQNQDQHIEILTKLADIGRHIGEWEYTLKYSRELLLLGQEIGDINNQSIAHINEGFIYSMRSLWSKAIEHYNEALKLAEESNFQEGLLKAYYGLAFVNEKIGDYTKAMEFFQNSMDLAKVMNSPDEIARGFRGFAVISVQRGDYDKALEYYDKCIELFLQTENYTELAKAYTGVGIIYFEKGEFQKVIEQNEQVIELTSRTGDVRMKGYGYSNASEAYANLNNTEKAMDYANKALDIFKKLDEKPMIGLVWMNFGIIYKNMGEWGKSREYLEKSIALLKEQEVPYYLADVTRQLGLMLAAQNTTESIDEGRGHLKESLEIYKEIGASKYIQLVRDELDKL
jgi:tetratricopeptide (TPR) repeat protein